MDADMLIGRILGDEGLTDGLNDPEARILIEWLVARAERIALETSNEADAVKKVETLCRKARGIKRFVILWCETKDHGAAAQLVGAERFHWPMPDGDNFDPAEVMHQILEWENQQLPASSTAASHE